MLKGLGINHYLLSCFIMILGINSSFATELVENSGAENTQTSLVASNNRSLLNRVQPIFTVSAGALVSSVGPSQSFAPLDLCSYNYKPQGSKTNMLWGGFIGSEVTTSSWGWIVGLGYYQPSSLSTKGTLVQGADSISDNTYSYRYQTQSQQFLAEGKLYWIAKEKIQPFLMVGIGEVFNKTSNYQTNVPPFLEFTPMFSSQTQTSFTYAIGPGIDVSLSKSFRVGIGYRLTDLGSVSTGSAQIDAIPISSTLKQSHLYANQILAQFTFLPWKKD